MLKGKGYFDVKRSLAIISFVLLIKQPYRLFVANEKFNPLTMNFIKKQCWLKVRRANLDQYACLKKVLLHPTSAVVFVDNVSSSSGRRG